MKNYRKSLLFVSILGATLAGVGCGSAVQTGGGGGGGGEVTGGGGGGVGGASPQAPGCPATPNPMNVGIGGSPDPSWTMGVQGVAGTVAAQAADQLTFQPDAQPWQVVLRFPSDLTLPNWAGQHASLSFGVDMPFWTESAFVLRNDSGALLLAGIDGSLKWINESMFQAPDLTVSLGGDCALRADACQDRLDHEVLLQGGGAPLSLVGGRAGQVTLGGALFDVRLGDAFTGVGPAQCTDLPSSWINAVFAPSP